MLIALNMQFLNLLNCLLIFLLMQTMNMLSESNLTIWTSVNTTNKIDSLSQHNVEILSG